MTKENKTVDPLSTLGADEKVLFSWMKSPRKFIIEALRFELKGHKLTSQQEECLEEVRKLVWAKIKSGSDKKLNKTEARYAKKMGISIMSGKGTGKDCLGAMLIIWFLCCFEYCKIPCTANSGKQLSEVLWSEIKKWLKDSLVEDWVVLQSDKIYMKVPKKEDRGKRWFATARTINVRATAEEQAETLQGFHEDFMMIVIDEASGIPEPVFRPFETTLTGLCNFVLMLFNPTRSNGYAIDSHGRYREDWVCLRWDAEKSDLAAMPQFKAQIERIERKYGRDSTAFRVNVKGLPPLVDGDTLIPWDWVMNAVEREIEPAEDEPLLLGVDVGAGGDRSVILHMHGGKVERIVTHNTPDTMELTGWVSADIEKYEVTAVFVDVIGLGNGVYNRLRELGHTRIYSVDVRNTARNNDRFHKLRDEIWWNLRGQFEKGTISIPNDDALICELTTIKYKVESNGKVKVEGKKDMKKRGLDSPDRADALCLTQFLPSSTFRRKRNDRYGHDSLDESRRGWMVA